MKKREERPRVVRLEKQKKEGVRRKRQTERNEKGKCDGAVQLEKKGQDKIEINADMGNGNVSRQERGTCSGASPRNGAANVGQDSGIRIPLGETGLGS